MELEAKQINGLNSTRLNVISLFQLMDLTLISNLNYQMWCSSRVCLCPLLFLIYINDLNLPIKYGKVDHFANDTKLRNINKSLQKLNRLINDDLILINDN